EAAARAPRGDQGQQGPDPAGDRRPAHGARTAAGPGARGAPLGQGRRRGAVRQPVPAGLRHRPRHRRGFGSGARAAPGARRAGRRTGRRVSLRGVGGRVPGRGRAVPERRHRLLVARGGERPGPRGAHRGGDRPHPGVPQAGRGGGRRGVARGRPGLDHRAPARRARRRMARQLRQARQLLHNGGRDPPERPREVPLHQRGRPHLARPRRRGRDRQRSRRL
ncbi:MAG: hypothetical protein AVDCRST_MAG02-770, partial [uncultured Rubrobacteraceae bacterium]